MSDLSSAPVLAGRLAAPTARVFVSDSDTEEVLRRAFGDVGVNDAKFTKGTIQTATTALASEATPRLLIVDICDAEDPLNSGRGARGKVRARSERRGDWRPQ